jgi:hypothetical protein
MVLYMVYRMPLRNNELRAVGGFVSELDVPSTTT